VPPDPITDEFDRAHLRLLTNKLAKQAALLAAFDSRLNALMRLGGGLPELREPHALLRKACVDARELFGAAHAVLAVRDSAARGNVFYTTSGIDSDLARPAALRLEIGPLGSMMSSRSTLRLSNPGGRSLGVELPRSYPAAHSILAVPLMTPTQTYGWLYLADKLGAEEFDARDEALISILGTVIGRSYEALSLNRAFAWQSRRLQHSEDRYRTRSKTCTQHVDRVYALLGGANRIMAMARDRDAFCKATCRLAIRQGHFRLAYIEIGAPNAVDMRLVAAAGDVRDSISLARRLSIQSAHQDELLSRALILRRPAVCNELQDDHPPVRLRDEMLSRGYRAVAALPLGNGNAVPGRLVLLTEKPQFFDASEMRLLTQLAGYISLALATARPRVASGEHR